MPAQNSNHSKKKKKNCGLLHKKSRSSNQMPTKSNNSLSWSRNQITILFKLFSFHRTFLSFSFFHSLVCACVEILMQHIFSTAKQKEERNENRVPTNHGHLKGGSGASLAKYLNRTGKVLSPLASFSASSSIPSPPPLSSFAAAQTLTFLLNRRSSGIFPENPWKLRVGTGLSDRSLVGREENVTKGERNRAVREGRHVNLRLRTEGFGEEERVWTAIAMAWV